MSCGCWGSIQHGGGDSQYAQVSGDGVFSPPEVYLRLWGNELEVWVVRRAPFCVWGYRRLHSHSALETLRSASADPL